MIIKEKDKKETKENVVRIVIGVLFFITVISVLINIYLLKKANENRTTIEVSKAVAEYNGGNEITKQKQENITTKPKISKREANAQKVYSEAHNNLFIACLKKGVVPLNTINYTVDQLRVYTVMANHNVFLEDFSVIAGDREAFENEMRNDEKAKEFYDQWAEYERSAKGKKSENKIYSNKFEAKKSIFLKVFGKELTDEEKNILKATDPPNSR